MRLGIAASVLATAIPQGNASRKQPHQTLARFKHDVNPYTNHPLRKLFQSRENGRRTEFGKQHSFHESKWSDPGLLKSGRSKNSVVECVPDADADVGVLACGTNEYCMEVSTSSMGGECVSRHEGVDHRYLHLDGYHGENLCGEYPYPLCDCSAWNRTTGTGVIECSEDPGCGEGCGLTLCLAYSGTYVHDGTTGVFEYFIGFSGSYERNLTFVSETNSGDYSCEIVIDGITCSHCSYYLNVCVSFDCTNAGEGAYDCTNGSGDGITIFDNVPYCNETLECNLCSDSGVIVDGNATVYLPFGPYACGFIYDITENGAYDDLLLCQYFIHYAEDSCCPAIFNPTSSPTVSFDEKSSDGN